MSPVLSPGILRRLRPKFFCLAIAFFIVVYWCLFMAYTPNTTPELAPFTFAYKVVHGAPIYLDVYPPSLPHNSRVFKANAADPNGDHDPVIVPALLYFHGGGLTVGNRKSWFPQWLQKRVTAAGYVFMSADYRLMPPATGHDIIDDIKDIFRFISGELNSKLSAAADGTMARFGVDPNAIAVAGSSAGGQATYWSAMHVSESPKPKAIVLLYAMGGDYLTPQYLTKKTVPFFRGREILDPADFSEYMHPFSDSLRVISDSPLAYNPPSSPIPGFPANPRMLLSRLYLQLGVLLDYVTGEHGLSDVLRKALASDKTDLAHSTGSDDYDAINDRLKQLIPERHHLLFPQFATISNWPPAYLVHGTLDTAVLVHESRYMHRRLEDVGVNVTLSVQEGKEHSFDYEPDAETVHGNELFDSVDEFLKEHLEKARRSKID